MLLARSEPSTWIPVKTKSDFVNIENSVFTNNEGIVDNVYMNTQNDPSTMNIV